MKTSAVSHARKVRSGPVRQFDARRTHRRSSDAAAGGPECLGPSEERRDGINKYIEMTITIALTRAHSEYESAERMLPGLL